MSDEREPQTGRRPEGKYVNYFEIGYNAYEFLLDFGQSFEGDEPGGEESRSVHTRIITSPSYAKMLAEMLEQSILRYEETFGPTSER
jgi:hypothetical protein